VHDICFTEVAIQEVVQKVITLYREQQSYSGSEKKGIEKKMMSLETNITNWIKGTWERNKGVRGQNY
jgi:hypothetical protein